MSCRVVDLIMFFFKQRTAYEMRISDWSSDVCSSNLPAAAVLLWRFVDADGHDLRRNDPGDRERQQDRHPPLPLTAPGAIPPSPGRADFRPPPRPSPPAASPRNPCRPSPTDRKSTRLNSSH